MYAHKGGRGQQVLEFFHACEYGEGMGVVAEVNLHVLAHPFDIEYVGDTDFHMSVFGLHEQVAVVACTDVVGGKAVGEFILAFHFPCGLVELVEAEGLEEIIDGIDFVSVEGIL